MKKRRITAVLTAALISLSILLGGCLEEVIMSIEAEGNMSMVFADSGHFYIWGDAKPYDGGDLLLPTLYEEVLGVIDVAAGDGFALWLARDGLFGTGNLSGLPIGHVGTERTDKPMKLIREENDTSEIHYVGIDDLKLAVKDVSYTQITAGAEHTLLLKPDGTVWAWGMNAIGQLGIGEAGIAVRTPVRVGNLEGVIAVAASRTGESIALDMNGSVWCWGGDQNLASPTKIEGLPEKIAHINAGEKFWVALDTEYRLWTWTAGDMTPKVVADLPPVWTVAVGDNFIAAVDHDGNIWTWGDNQNGQLGRDTGGNADHTPTKIADFSDVISLTAGYRHAMVMRKDGSVWLWGANHHGQLGDGTTNDSFLPIRLENLTTRVGN